MAQSRKARSSFQERAAERRRARHAAGEREEAARLAEAAIQARLRADPRREKRARLRERLRSTELLDHLERTAPRLVHADFADRIVAFDRLHHRFGWSSPLAEWRPRGRSVGRQWRDLTTHLLVPYPIPDFLRAEIFAGTKRWGKLAIFLGRGGSLHRARRAGEFRFLPPLSKRAIHRLTLSPVDHGPWVAVRQAQLEALGASAPLVQSILGSSLHGRLPDEARAQRAFEWLVTHEAALPPWQVRPLVDYFVAQLRESEEWDPAGRPPWAMLRRMREWHEELARLRSVDHEVFSASGIPSHRTTVRTDDGSHERWEVREILTAKELLREGRSMFHCVFYYREEIRAGRCSIWSLRRDGERALTIEVAGRDLVQAAGRANRPPTAEERRVVKQWASRARLRIVHR